MNSKALSLSSILENAMEKRKIRKGKWGKTENGKLENALSQKNKEKFSAFRLLKEKRRRKIAENGGGGKWKGVDVWWFKGLTKGS